MTKSCYKLLDVAKCRKSSWWSLTIFLRQYIVVILRYDEIFPRYSQVFCFFRYRTCHLDLSSRYVISRSFEGRAQCQSHTFITSRCGTLRDTAALEPLRQPLLSGDVRTVLLCYSMLRPLFNMKPMHRAQAHGPRSVIKSVVKVI